MEDILSHQKIKIHTADTTLTHLHEENTELHRESGGEKSVVPLYRVELKGRALVYFGKYLGITHSYGENRLHFLNEEGILTVATKLIRGMDVHR